jgi:hypothetical protein
MEGNPTANAPQKAGCLYLPGLTGNCSSTQIFSINNDQLAINNFTFAFEFEFEFGLEEG